ncbi:YopT-type cysteine protease domain-containing protein [Endozoicomonas sp.]|uniref:YopT-type cysteine protease domain-containing protein n=1 Tax=Endozoicomonas sp. TaxID=1892382 RepID=UPI0028885282|nr:hypothetical protein [Endozoicomonas sp.]
MKYMEAYFSQCEVMYGRVGRNSVAELGACHNFSLHWLRLILSDRRMLPKARMSKMKKNSGGANLLMQYVYGLRFSPNELIESDKMLLRLRGLKALNPTIGYSSYYWDDLFSHICWTKGGFVYSFWFESRNKVSGAESDAHSIAFYRTSVGLEGFIIVYDPNFGEFHVIPEDFPSFWRELASVYGSFHSHLLREIEIDGKDCLHG